MTQFQFLLARLSTHERRRRVGQDNRDRAAENTQSRAALQKKTLARFAGRASQPIHKPRSPSCSVLLANMIVFTRLRA